MHVYVPHTTAAVAINEAADPDVMADVLMTLERLVPWQGIFFMEFDGPRRRRVLVDVSAS